MQLTSRPFHCRFASTSMLVPCLGSLHHDSISPSRISNEVWHDNSKAEEGPNTALIKNTMAVQAGVVLVMHRQRSRGCAVAASSGSLDFRVFRMPPVLQVGFRTVGVLAVDRNSVEQ